MVAPVNLDLEQHEVVLHGAWPVAPAAEPGPTLIERTDEDFLPALLEELKSPNPHFAIAAARPKQPSNAKTLRLFQPVHRVFNLVLLEAHCKAFGEPRLDPRKIDSCGFVVRRVAVAAKTGQPKRTNQGQFVYEGWLADRSKVTGWVELTDGDADPEPSRRPPTRLTGDFAFDAEFRGGPPTIAEAATPLFVVTPDVAEATGRTVLYGVLSLTSDSRAGEVPKGDEPNRGQWEQHLSLLLQASTTERALWPAGTMGERGATLARTDLSAESLPTGATRFLLLVRQLSQEFSLLRPANPQTAGELIDELNKLSVKLVDGSSRPAGDCVRSAAHFYFEETADVSPLQRPQTWPTVSVEAATRLYNLLRQMAGEVALSYVAPANRGGRFDDATRLYAVRAFLRLKCARGCPPKIVWSQDSEPFEIAPWFEQGPVAPVPIVLPDPSDILKSAKPGVSFAVPGSLAKLLNQDPKNFLKGTPGKGTDLGVDWMCGFNIPIITICAFIVLNIFLNLLNIVLFWLPFVKICIPFPRKK